LHLVSACVDPRWLVAEHRARVAVERNQVILDSKLLQIDGLRTASGRVLTGAAGLASGFLCLKAIFGHPATNAVREVTATLSCPRYSTRTPAF